MATPLIHITITALHNNGRRDRNVYGILVGKSYRMMLLIYRNGGGDSNTIMDQRKGVYIFVIAFI